ncbi:hypothetical protein DRP77_04370, partial [Candidatus Poribacteria bacterium]
VFRDELSSLFRSIPILFIGLLALSASLAVNPSAPGDLLASLREVGRSPEAAISPKVVEVSPGNLKVRSGESVEITAKVINNIKSLPVKLIYRLEGGGWHESMMAREGGEIYSMRLENLTRSIEYYVSVSDSRSPVYAVTVIREPMLGRFRYEIVYPPYTGLSPRLLEWNGGDIRALVGSVATLKGESTKPLQSASIAFESGARVELEIGEDGRTVEGEFKVEKEDRYRFELTDTEGISNTNPVEYVVVPIEDEPPKLQFISPEPDVMLDESMLLPIRVAAEDDFGIVSMKLVYEIEGSTRRGEIELRKFEKPITAITFDYTWDLDPIGLLPDDVVRYWVEARDANDVTGPGIGRTEVQIARMPSVEDLYAEVEGTQKEQEEALREMLRRGSEARDVLEGIIEKLRKGEKLTWAERKELEQVIQTQGELERMGGKIAEELKRMIEDIRKNELFTVEMIQKLEEMRRLFEEVASQELKEAMRKLSEALQKLNLSDQLRNLEDAKLNQEEFLKRIERTIELLKRMLVQQKVEKAARLAKEMEETQRKILSSLQEMIASGKKEGLEELARGEERMVGKLGSLRKQIESSLEEMRAQNAYPELTGAVESVLKEASSAELEKQLGQAAQMMRGSKPEGAIGPAGEAMRGIAGISSQLQGILEAMRGRDASELIKEIDSIVNEGLYLLKMQRGLLERIKRMTEGVGYSEEIDLSSAAEAQQLLAESTALISSRVWELSKREMGVDPSIAWRLNEAEDAMRRAISAMEDRRYATVTLIQKEAVEGLSTAVLKLLETLDALNQQMGAAGLERMFEQLQRIIQAQADLNKLSEMMRQQIRRRGVTPSLEKLLEQMAMEQRMIREALERLAEKMDRLREVLGKLEDVAQEMRDVEDSLRRKKLDDQVIEKQRRILTRLLESDKSLRKEDEESKRRVATTAKKTFTPSKAGPIDEKLLRIRKRLEAEINSLSETPLPQGYRELVRRYFRILSEIER